MKKLKLKADILSKNKYPPKIVSNTIRKFQELKKHGPKTKIDTSYDVPKKKVILVLPYYRGADEIKKEITNFVLKSFPQVDFQLGLTS